MCTLEGERGVGVGGWKGGCISLSQGAVSQSDLAGGGGGGGLVASSAAQTSSLNFTSQKSKEANVGYALKGPVSAPDGSRSPT